MLKVTILFILYLYILNSNSEYIFCLNFTSSIKCIYFIYLIKIISHNNYCIIFKSNKFNRLKIQLIIYNLTVHKILIKIVIIYLLKTFIMNFDENI